MGTPRIPGSEFYNPEVPQLRQGFSGDAAAAYGVDSPLFDQEWNAFLARRKELLDNLTARMQLANGMAQTTGTTPEQMLPFAHAQLDQVDLDNRRSRAQAGQNDLNDLIGIARFHGIPEPEKLPPDLLAQMIEERRAQWEPERANAPRGAGFFERGEGHISDLMSSYAGGMAFGSMKAIVDAVQRIPFLGDALAKSRTVQAADQSISMMLEGLSVDLPEDRLQSFKILQGTGGIVGYSLLAAPLYRAATALIPAPYIVNGRAIDTIGRAALRGAATAWALEGGGDDPILPSDEMWQSLMDGDWKAAAEILETRAGKIGAGAAFGALFDYALPNLVRRVQNSFRSRLATEAGRFADEGPIMEADYYMVGGREIGPGQRQIGPAQRLIGSPTDEISAVGVFDETGPIRPANTDRLYPVAIGPVRLPAGGGNQLALPAPGLPPVGLPPATSGPMGLVRQLDDLGVQLGPSGFPEEVVAPAATPEVMAPPVPMEARPERLLGTPLMNENATLRGQLAQMIEQRNLAQRMAEIDGLTHLGNRRALDRALPVAEADDMTAVVAFDADGFKAVNDIFGHAHGDEALLGFANAMADAADQLGISQRFFRPGGDEFVALVPVDRANQFRELVETLSEQQFGNLDSGIFTETRLTGAIGQTLAEADGNLIVIKGGRRTQVQGFTPTEASAEALAISRQNTVLESPHALDVATQPQVDESDLIQAAMTSNPAGVNVIRGLNDAGGTIRRMAEAEVSIPVWNEPIPHPTNPLLSVMFSRTPPVYRAIVYEGEQVIEISEAANLNTLMADVRSGNGFISRGAEFWGEQGGFSNIRTRRVMPQFMRVAETQDIITGEMRQDLLISNGQPISNQMVQDYRNTGLYVGAQVHTYDGISGVVTSLVRDPETSGWLVGVNGRPAEAGGWSEEYTLIRGNSAVPSDLDSFVADFTLWVEDGFVDVRGPDAPSLQLTDRIVLPQLAGLLDDYLDLRGVMDQTTRAAYRAGVNLSVNQELRALAPVEDQALVNQLGQQLDDLIGQSAPARRRRRGEARADTRTFPSGSFEPPRPALSRVQELAEYKGFEYVPTAPPALRYGGQISISAPYESFGTRETIIPASVRIYDTRTGNYAGNLDGYLEPTGRFFVSYVEAFGAGGPTALGTRVVRDIGRQIVARFRAEGHTVTEVYGHRVSGARHGDASIERAAWNADPARLAGYEPTDQYARLDADRLMQGVRLGGTLKHKLSDLEVPVDSDEAALAFLADWQGELPDVAPITEFPIDAMPSHPAMDNPGHSLPPVWNEGFEQYMDNYVDMLNRTERYVDEVFENYRSPAEEPDRWSDQFAGGGFPPPGPPPPPARRGGGFPTSGGTPGGGFPGTEVRSETLGQQFRTLIRNNPRAVADILRRQDSAYIRMLEPMRHRFLALEQELMDLGVTQGRIWQHYSDLTTAVDKAHNEAGPWHEEWSGITSRFRRKYRRDGTVVRIEEIPNWNDKLRAMQDAGYTPAEMEAQAMIRPFFDRMHGMAGISNYVFDYIPMLRQRQGMSGIEDPFGGTQASLPAELDFFAEHVRGTGVDMRQLDIGTLGALWIRGWQFKKHAKPAWDTMYRAWSDSDIPQQLRDLVLDWMHVVRVGHDPKQEVAVSGVRQVLNSFGIPVTDGEIADLWNGLLTNTYRSMLGGRPDVIFRDSVQPLLSWARVGGDLGVMRDVYLDYIRNPKIRGEILERAERMGTVVRGMTQTAYAEAFTQRVQTAEGIPLFDERLARRRDAIARLGDAIYDFIPRRFRGGIQGTWADPLLMYTKLGEMNRILSGEYGYRIAIKPLEQYYRGEITFDELMAKSRARAYPQPIQRRFTELVQQGKAEDAAALMANESANLQLRYGSREAPIGSRNVPGRIATMFGTFSQQFFAYTKEGLRHGTMADRAGFATRYAAIMTALGIAGAYTGWKFSKWMWHNSLLYAGGPALEFATEALTAWRGWSAELQGQDAQPNEMRAMENMTPGNVLGGFAESVFPYSGAIRTGQRLSDTMDPTGEYNMERTLNLLMTGESSWGPIYQREWNNPVEPVIPQWTPQMGTGGFRIQPGTPPVSGQPVPAPAPAYGDTLQSPAEVQVMLEALRTTPPDQWRSRMEGAGFNPAIIDQVVRAGGGAIQ